MFGGASAARDYSLTDNFSEDPIGFILDLPDEAAGYINTAFQSLEDALSAAIDGIGGATVSILPDWFTNNILPRFISAQTEASPLVLDLDGDGVELISLSSANAVYWDLDQDGMAEASGWVDADDGLLAYDWNEDGVIDDHSELFGTAANDNRNFKRQAAA